jgi:aryl carrier-like protein
VNLTRWYIDQIDLDTQSVGLLISAIGFDLTQKNIFSAFTVGASLRLPHRKTSEIDAIIELIIEDKTSWLNCTPSAFSLVLDAAYGSKTGIDSINSINYLVLGGEPIESAKLERWLQETSCHVQVLNSYGPTECSDVTVAWTLAIDDYSQDIAHRLPIHSPIGRPIPNTQIYILDAALNPLPVGVIGELYIAGGGLARGYLGRAGLTADRFIANPFVQSGVNGTLGARMYRSGDLARWTEDGVLEYLGRADAQVKIRGFRIELGEIEAALLSIPGIAQCTVQARGEEGAKQLVAYLVADTDTDTSAKADSDGVTDADASAIVSVEAAIPEPSILKSTLSSTLPDYMVPSAFVVLESLPLTPNGKLDVRALPAPEVTGGSDYRPPETEHEHLVAGLFTELTGATRVGLDDSFFALGGHSLLAMRLISQLRARTGLELALRTLFEQPTVAGLAQALVQVQIEQLTLAASGMVSISRPPILAGQGVANPQADGTQRVLSYGQIRLWTITQIDGPSGSYNVPAALRLSGTLQSKALALALRDVIQRHEPLRTVIMNVDGAPLG